VGKFNYGWSVGVDSRNGKPVRNKLSCQSLRIFPPPPGFWEQEVCIPIHPDEDDRDKKWCAVARGMMFSDRDFVPCQHPQCWICMGQKEHPTQEQIDAFVAPERDPNRLTWMGLGLLPGEEVLWEQEDRKLIAALRPSRMSKRERIRALLSRIFHRVFG